MVLTVILTVIGLCAFLIAWNSVLHVASTKAGICGTRTYPFEYKLIPRNIKRFVISYLIQATCFTYVVFSNFEDVDGPTALFGTVTFTSIFFTGVYKRKRPENRIITKDLPFKK